MNLKKIKDDDLQAKDLTVSRDLGKVQEAVTTFLSKNGIDKKLIEEAFQQAYLSLNSSKEEWKRARSHRDDKAFLKQEFPDAEIVAYYGAKKLFLVSFPYSSSEEEAQEVLNANSQVPDGFRKVNEKIYRETDTRFMAQLQFKRK